LLQIIIAKALAKEPCWFPFFFMLYKFVIVVFHKLIKIFKKKKKKKKMYWSTLDISKNYAVCFQVQYPQSKACRMSQVHVLPPVFGSIIWARQIDRQLTAYLRRVEDVLGKPSSYFKQDVGA
jgi:hypothetical protein